MSDDLTTAYLIGAEHMREKLHKQADINGRLLTKNAELRQRIAELEAALKPFADKATACEQRYSDFVPEDDRTFAFTLGDLRQARKVLGEK